MKEDIPATALKHSFIGSRDPHSKFPSLHETSQEGNASVEKNNQVDAEPKPSAEMVKAANRAAKTARKQARKEAFMAADNDKASIDYKSKLRAKPKPVQDPTSTSEAKIQADKARIEARKLKKQVKMAAKKKAKEAKKAAGDAQRDAKGAEKSVGETPGEAKEAVKPVGDAQRAKNYAKKVTKETTLVSSFKPSDIPGLSLLSPKDPLSTYKLPPPPNTGQLQAGNRYGRDRILAMKRPMPTPEYLAAVARGHHRLLATRPLLVVLDLNGVLVHRGRGSTAFTPRPDLDAFLDYVFAHHHVMVWSSGMPVNVVSICQRVFTPAQFSALVGIWARDTLRIPQRLFRENVQVYKQLSWIWESPVLQVQAAAPTALCNGIVGVYSQSNTILIDDSSEKALAEPFNLLQVQEFVGNNEVSMEGGQGILSQAAAYLSQLGWASDVSAYLHSAAAQKGQQLLKITTEDETNAVAELLAKTDAHLGDGPRRE